MTGRMWHGIVHAVGALRPRTRVLFYPSPPGQQMIAWKLCRALGWAITANPARRADIVFRWDNATFAEDDAQMTAIKASGPVVNHACHDISKNRVNEMFEKAFGYALGIDPRTHVGECVEKSDDNATHDGRVITCPISHPREGAAYQRVIDNVREDGRIMDIRIPIMGRAIPLAYLRFRPVDRRFLSGNEDVAIAQVHDVLSQDEVHDVLRFCELLGLDYGELDVLRDRGDGRLYVVDANPTPWGPPSGIGRGDGERAIALLSATFKSEFLLTGAWSRRDRSI